MSDTWNDNFNNYTLGDLNGQGGWVGDDAYDVLVGGDDQYVRSHYKSQFPNSASGGITNTINLSPINRIILSGYLGIAHTQSPSEACIYLRNASNAPMCGIRIRTDATRHADVAYNIDGSLGWISVVGSLSAGVLYPFLLEYDTNTGIYEQIVWNNVSYPKKELTTVGNNINNIRLFAGIYDIYQEEVWGYYDNLNIYPNPNYPFKKKKYVKFPRWQKTKYGLRPFY